MQARKTRILADQPAKLRFSRFGMLATAVGTALLGMAAVTTAVPDVAAPPIPVQSVIEKLGAPKIEPYQTAGELPFVYDGRVEPGDTIYSIFQRLGIDDDAVLGRITQSPEGKEALRQLRAGRSVTAIVDTDGRVQTLSLPVAQGNDRFTIRRLDDGQVVTNSDTGPADTVAVVEMRSARIENSLFGATDAAGIPDEIASKLAEIFGTEIDFHTDLRKGDEFSVIYESIFDEGVPVRAGRILAAEFVNQGKRHQVVLFRNASGHEEYYSADGHSLRQAFLRSPLAFTRITSGFGRRFHPILKNWRTHAGVDFAAPTGTPVKATSDGTVKFVGVQRGYGNIVVLQHRGPYATAYAHLSRFAKGLHNGQRISQGDVIAYVGSTGWATGPHLHYEIRVDNQPRDPLRIALPTAQPLDSRDLALFKRQSSPMIERLALLNHTSVAQAQ